MTRRIARRAALLASLLGAAALPAVATATDGPLYRLGPSIWSATSPMTAHQSAETVVVEAAQVASIATGNKWEMLWQCPVPGSEIAQVYFGGLRTAAASSLEVRVTGDRQTLWAIPDAALPQSPDGGRIFVASLPPGQCTVHLALTQVENRAQHRRVWFIDNPSVVVRDLTAPGVALRHGDGNWFGATARPYVLGWNTSDNFGSDGVREQSVTIGGTRVWTGSPGVGDHDLALGLGGLPDGRHRVVIRAQGDGTGDGTAETTVSIDRTPPEIGSWPTLHPGTARTVTLPWLTGDAVSGMGASSAQIGYAGQWHTVAQATGAGTVVRTITVPASIAEGVHPWRIVGTDVAGNARAVAGEGTVIVDTTAPSVDVVGAPTGWVRTADITADIDDNLADELGLGAVEVDINTAGDARADGVWERVLTTSRSAGRVTLPIDPSGLADGAHLVRLRVRNADPFGLSLVGERTLTLRVDRTPPTIAGVAFSPAGPNTVKASWAADDPLAGMHRAIVQWAEGEAWRTLGQTDITNGAGAMVVDAAVLGAGDHRLRIAAVDGAGNVAVREGSLTMPAAAPVPAPAVPTTRSGDDPAATAAAAPRTAEGFGSTAHDPLARLRTARLHLAAPGARMVRGRDGRTTLVIAGPSGAPVRLTARLIDASGAAIAGTELEARGHRGAVVGRTRTQADGRATITVRADAGGPVRIGVPADGALLPARAERGVHLRLRPHITLRRPPRAVRTGDTVMFRGRLRPAPARLGLTAAKGVVLEWRDPLRGVWRPVVNARLRPDGSFTIPWRFALNGVAVPLRVRVPTEIGWPLTRGLSRSVVVTPR